MGVEGDARSESKVGAGGEIGTEGKAGFEGDPRAETDTGVKKGPSDFPKVSIWLIDGYNVLHAVLLGGRPREGTDWWGEAGRNLLHDRVREFDGLAATCIQPPDAPEAAESEPPGNEPQPGSVWIVFDGTRPTPQPSDANPQIVFAPSADQWIVGRVRSASDPRTLAVVSADRQVAGRCRHAGATVVAPRDFIARCGPPEPE